MKTAYVSTHDASNILAWSGLVHHIAKALELQGFRLEYVDALEEKYGWLTWKKIRVYRYLARVGLRPHVHLQDREPSLLRSYAVQVSERLSSTSVDLVFSPETPPICKVECKQPIAFWTDATFAGMVGFYPRFRNLSSESIRHGNAMEQEALSRCRLAIYSSKWAARSAVENYNVAPGKIHVVPFGANIPCDRSFDDIKTIVGARAMDRCNLLFIGVEWQRKGGDVAVQIAEALNEQGLPTELAVVGCDPPGRVPDCVTAYGFVSKASPQGIETIGRLLAESHFLILPSRAECLAVVIAEAGSFGLPSVASDTGGIPTALRDGANGRTFSTDGDMLEYCSFISHMMSHPAEYRELALSSFNEYRTRLNWRVAGERVRALIHEICL